jgi:tetratricopeptide (TPR) repeat protein
VEAAASDLELTYLADQLAEDSASPQPEFIEAEQALPPRVTPPETLATEPPVRKTPTPIELAPLVEAPEEAVYTVDETPIEFESEQPTDTMVPTLHETSLVDPLAGLDVIETPTSAGEETASDDTFVDLGEWLASTRTPQSTRMVTHDEEPEDNQQKDFAEMLQKFKEGVAQSVDVEDFASHYDLGVAFREMGLVDEAIAAFQKALRGPGQRIRASEALGECFIDKGESAVAVTVLERVLRDQSLDDEKLIGVLYLMGKASEALGKQSEATSYYQRVFAVDIGFRDIGERMSGLTQATR